MIQPGSAIHDTEIRNQLIVDALAAFPALKPENIYHTPWTTEPDVLPALLIYLPEGGIVKSSEGAAMLNEFQKYRYMCIYRDVLPAGREDTYHQDIYNNYVAQIMRMPLYAGIGMMPSCDEPATEYSNLDNYPVIETGFIFCCTVEVPVLSRGT